MLLAPTDSDPLDESDEADAILLYAPIYLADAAADGRGTGKQLQRVRKSTLTTLENPLFMRSYPILSRNLNVTLV